jgi:ribose 5-phosphate isomerase B
MKIAVGSDHRGLDFKQYVVNVLTGLGHSYKDFGSFTTESVDYPDIAEAVAEAVAKADFDSGILICGTGIGMCIAANKVNGIRAAVSTDVFSAQRARQHNDANILCLGAERGESGVKEIIETFLSTQFEGGRHQRRVDKMKEMEARSAIKPHQ